MTTTSFQQTWQRMLGAINARTDAALAGFLSITPAAVSSVKKKQKIPASWFDTICQKTGVSRTWLIGSYEENQKKQPPSPTPAHVQKFPTHPSSQPLPQKNSSNIAELISQAIEILESQSEYAESLKSIITALHRAILMEQQMTTFGSEVMKKIAAFQKYQKQD